MGLENSNFKYSSLSTTVTVLYEQCSLNIAMRLSLVKTSLRGVPKCDGLMMIAVDRC